MKIEEVIIPYKIVFEDDNYFLDLISDLSVGSDVPKFILRYKTRIGKGEIFKHYFYGDTIIDAINKASCFFKEEDNKDYYILYYFPKKCKNTIKK